MSIRRTLTLSGIVGLSAVVIGFVAADRLGHGPAAPAPARIAGAASEPETTGTVVPPATQQTVTQQGAQEAKPTRLVNGFDTERLNALMRGELPPPPAPAPSRKR